MADWSDIINSKVSFSVNRIKTYNRSFFDTCGESIKSSLNSGDLMSFIKGSLDPSHILSTMHERLIVNYRNYKSEMILAGRSSSAISEDRDHWYTISYECLPEDIQNQYSEIVHIVLTHLVELQLSSDISKVDIHS